MKRFCLIMVFLLLLCLAGPWPVQAQEYSNAPTTGNLSSSYGWRSDPFTGGSRFHAGIDIAAPEGTPVYLPQPGTVVYAGRYAGYGNVVVIHHLSTLYTIYGHNSVLYVHPGERLQRGAVLARVGSTGRSTGPHLHFEVRFKGTYLNPFDYLAWLKQVYNQGPRLVWGAGS